MATDLKKTDVVIVGLGAVGGVAALPLAQAGLEVIGLEAGTWLTPRDFAPDEVRNNYRAWPQAVQKANLEIPTHRANASAPYSPRATIHPMMNAVGGTSLHYWAQSWRLNPWDFKVVSETTRRYGASRIPKGSTVEDWPFDLPELEPYYDKVEYEIGISGKAGNINGKIDPRGNIFEGPRKREYPMPPLRGTDFTERMAGAARKLGWNAFPGPAAVNSQAYQNRPGCVYHGFCSRGGCHLNAKNSTAVSTIPRAQETGRLKVVTRAHVTSISVDTQGRATGVVYLQDGQEYVQPADVVLLAGYTYENVRMLLLSTSKSYPSGLSNNHGQVGKHYMTHNTQAAVIALFPSNLNTWYGLPAQGVAVDNWADDNFDHAGLDFIGGGYIPANEFCMRYSYVADLTYKRGQLFTGVTAEHFSKDEQAGVLRAFDVNQNKIVWEWSNRTPLISHTLSTAGNLVFQGTAEGRVVAVDAKDGKELWSFNLGTPQSGGIISYAVDGKQYIAVVAGGTLRSQVWFGKEPKWTDAARVNYSDIVAVFGLSE